MAIGKKKRTLADEIAELTNPAPVHQDVDPELLDFGADALRAMDVDDAEEDKHIMRHTPGRLRMKGDLSMEGVKYLGKKTSRKALLGSDLEAHSAEDGEGSESEEEDDKDEDAMEGTTEEKHSNEGGLEDKKRERIRQRAQEDEDGQQQTGSESEHEDERADMAEGDLLENEEIKALDKEYQQILHQEEEMLQTVRSRSAVDYKKAHAVANQRMLWDKALELCILCQRLLSIGNRLPQPVAWPIIRGASEEASTKFKDVSKAAAEALSVTLDLEKTLLERNEAILAARGSAELTGNGLKRPREEADGEVMPGAEEDGATVDALWQQIDENYHLFVPYRNKSVDRWQRKVQLSAGGAAVRGRLRALNQSITTQVASAMRDPSKIVNRTRLKRSQNNVLGERIADAEGMKSISRDEAGQRPDGVVNESALQENAVEMGVEEAGDPETFDDGEFFQQLLREFLETGKPSGGGSLSGYALKKLNKQKKLVDRRASKGRKIRYTVMQPLVNFMVPETIEIPPMSKKLFSTLFGSGSLGKLSGAY